MQLYFILGVPVMQWIVVQNKKSESRVQIPPEDITLKNTVRKGMNPALSPVIG